MACLLGETAVIERLHAAGMVAQTVSAAKFRMRVAGDVAKWASVIADANMERIGSVDGIKIKFGGRPNAIVLAMFGPRRRGRIMSCNPPNFIGYVTPVRFGNCKSNAEIKASFAEQAARYRDLAELRERFLRAVFPTITK